VAGAWLEEKNVNPYVLTILTALLFILIFGGLPVLRKEEPSLQLVAGVLVLTALVIAFSMLTGIYLHPVIFLILLYMSTMRCRVLVDLGNLLSSWGQHQRALSLYRLSMRLGPDSPALLSALISYGAVLVRVGALDEAIRVLEEVLEKWGEDLPPQHEAACHYNLGVAYLRMDDERRAVREFNQTIDAWPPSPYAQRASAALERRRSTGRLRGEERGDEREA
jgi:tetratricopeptide (TPR) repeat protein